MDSAWNLEYIFKLLFQEHSHRNIDEITSLIDSRREKTEVHNNGGDTANNLEEVLVSIELLLKIFNSNYETRFEVYIEYIFDQIQSIVKLGTDKSTFPNLPLGNIINLIDLVLDISISHSCKGIMTKLAEFYICMLRTLKSNDFPLSEEESILRLRIISTFYVIVNKKKFESQIKDMKQLITDINADSCESELFAKLVFSSSKVIAAQTLINVIPVYMEFSGSNTILQLIWNKISQSLAGNNYEFSKVFIVLCYLSDVYFAPENKKVIDDIFQCNSYLVLLQKGLIHSDSCVRKQALFLLKKVCHYLRDNQISLIKQDESVSDISKTYEKCNILIKYDWNTMFDVFSELWCIIEYLEETQIHLLEPIIDVIDSFSARNKEKLDISWILIIIQRMISHDNKTIIKKGFLNMLSIPICDYHNDEILADAAKLVVSTLKCTQIYSPNWQVVVDELKVYFVACSRQRNGKEFFKLLLNEIANERWGPEALFFVIYALQSVEPKKYWGRNELDLIKKILNGTVNHYTYMKSATQWQLLNIAINFLASHVALDDVASLLTCFLKNTCLMKKNNLWNKIVKLVRDSYKTEDVERFLKKSISDHIESMNIGKMILILFDVYSDDKEMTQKMTNLLRNILVTFADVHVRPYSDAGTQEFYLSIVCDFMEESSGNCTLMNIISPMLPDILNYIEMKLDCSHHIRDFEKSQDLLRRLDTVFNFCKSDHAALEIISNWFEKIMKNLVIEPVEFLPLQKFIQIKTLTVIIANNIGLVSHPKMEFVGPFLKSELCAPLEKTAEDSIVTEDLQKLWGKMNSEYLKRKWELLSYVTGSPVDVLQISNSDFIRLCLDAIDTGGAAVLLPLLGALGKALSSLLPESQLKQLMDSIFNVMLERKKNDDFYQLIQSYIEITFQPNVICTKEENIRGMLLEHSRQLFSENNVNIANAFIKHVQKLRLVTRGKYFLLDLLPRALLFGQIQRKDERLISDICTVIEKENISPLMNDFNTNVEVRARAIKIVITLNGGSGEDRKFAEDLIDALIKFEESLNKNKTRYFADSNAHRYKERLMQSLLVLVDLISEVKSAELWTWLCNKLLLENNQPSVRYLQEWLMLRLICNDSRLGDKLWECFDKCVEKRTGSLCSLISVAYHLLLCIPMFETKMKSHIDNAMRRFLPYCMAQHFSVRLYAQVTLQKLMNLMKTPNLISLREKYGVVSEILSESIRSGNAVKNCSKMLEDFYFTEFNPVSHYTLETIFYEFPRLTSVGSQDLIPVSLFKHYGVNEENCIIPVENRNDSLKRFSYGKWIVDGSNQVDLFADSEENKEIELSNLQKKMIPIKYLVPDVEDLLQFVSYSADDKNKEGLIVVASLIDRLPNLGGLCRTCEVFGASEFVIGSLKYLEDQQFKSLSVTAEKWIPITEVKPYHLSEYLTKMKLDGYTILAAEQTVNSQPLESVKFPKKSILLLGNEKEGIPPTLLPLTDVSVEIPQKGIIRSLNVHVTGALFIWEYAKQHNSFTRI